MNQLDDEYRLNRVTLGDPRIVIAILDGPVDVNHPSLATADLRDLNVDCIEKPPFDTGAIETAAIHGTFVCSIIFGQGPEGVLGIAPQCRGILIPIFREGPTAGTILPCSQVELAIAIDRAVTEGANIINISGGQYSTNGTVHPILKRVIDRAAEEGVLIVSATGNDSCRCHHIPSAYPTVLAVGALDQKGNALKSSNWGERYRHNGVVAPGENLWGAVPGGTDQGSGTSFSTAIVSGVAALLMSHQLNAGKPANGAEVQQAILRSAHRCFESTESCQRMLAGKLNPIGALNLLIEESQPMPNELKNMNNMNDPNVQMEPQNSSPLEDNSAAELISPAGIKPSDCGCGCSAKGSLVFVIGEIGYDFGTEARRDSIRAHMMAEGFGEIPEDEEKLAKYLHKNPWDAGSVIWTITLNNVPIYAVRPGGPYAAEAYRRLVEFLDDNHKRAGRRVCNHVAIPGRIIGQTTLLRTGQSVPVIQPEIRGMANWDTDALVGAVLTKDEKKDEDLVRSLTKILEKIYHEHQNLGIRPQDRAINYAASNTSELTKMIRDAKENKAGTMFFDNIECEPSEICRPGSECWVIKINFFVHDQTDRSRRMYRFSVDVSDLVPVALSDMQDWYVR